MDKKPLVIALESIRAQIDALLIQLNADPAPTPQPQPGPTPVANEGAILTLKSTSGKQSATTGTAKVTAGMVVEFANGRATTVTYTDDGITFLTAEPAADTADKLAALTSSTLKVKRVPGTKPAPLDPPPVVTPTPQPATNPLNWPGMHGVNMSGLGNNPYVENAKEGQHYRAPEEKHFKKYADMGCRLVRLPTALERWNEGWDEHLMRVLKALDHAGKYGMGVIVDIHSYYRYWTKVPAGYKQRQGYDLTNYNGVTKEWRPIGTEGCALSVAQHAALVGKIVNALKSHPAYLGLGIANEPHDRGEPGISVNALWIKDVQQHVDAAAAASDKHWIFVGGCHYSSCRQWPSVSDALKNIKDVNDRVIYEGHNYLDKNTTGGGNWSNRAEQIPLGNFVAMVKPLVEWGKANKKRVYIGEHGYPEGNQSAEAATIEGLQYLTENGVPSTQWCAGPGWPAGDVLALDDDNGTFKTNVNAVKQFFGK